VSGNTARKAVVAACMESPFYFTLPLQKRLELLKQIEQQPVFSTLRQDFLAWIKTGILNSSEKISLPSQPGRMA
jgi:hypothetical protein